MKPLSIVFAGTPAFALPCLDALASSEHKLKAIYTQPDRPAGRGRKLQASPVKEWALPHELPVYQPSNFKDRNTIDELAALAPDVMVVIAYGLILPEAVLNTPRLGCINVHASLLPNWRGASPIQHAILHGDVKSGVTIMQMDKGMDTGDALTIAECPIHPSDTAETLHDRLAELAVAPLLTTLAKLSQGQITPAPQNNELATYAPKINKEDGLIDWSQPARVLERKIRAFNPWPIAYTSINNTLLKIHQARIIAEKSTQIPGTILSLDRNGMAVAAGDGILLIERLQFPGGKAMSVQDWLNAGRRDLLTGMILK